MADPGGSHQLSVRSPSPGLERSQTGLSDQPESDDKRFPVGKVLVQRSDADSRDLGHPVGVKASQRLFGQNASSRLKNRLDGYLRPRLTWLFSSFKL